MTLKQKKECFLRKQFLKIKEILRKEGMKSAESAIYYINVPTWVNPDPDAGETVCLPFSDWEGALIGIAFEKSFWNEELGIWETETECFRLCEGMK